MSPAGLEVLKDYPELENYQPVQGGRGDIHVALARVNSVVSYLWGVDERTASLPCRGER